ncbi:hypothetical protein EJ03DRAFT_324258 [Teratosphaeria nubilosa]|uniref:Uncharacterized protein n=1 Tax=Teratosphaeria nubilosa TaxID=161662 RepID=A0A6G1LJF9_9PEZI|nr:hypothetical protein EJ03DRAFT_324258 [Teratosphaeria nubilosa]
MTSCRAEYASQQLRYDAAEDALRLTHFMHSQRYWSLWSALREIHRREASKEEDLIHGVVGLLGITLSPTSIRYGVRLEERCSFL